MLGSAECSGYTEKNKKIKLGNNFHSNIGSRFHKQNGKY